MCESRVDRPEFLAKVRLQGCTAEKVGFNLTIYSMSGTSPPQLPSLQYCSNTDKFLEAFFHKAQTRILQPGMAMRSLVGKGGAPVMDDVENADGDGENGGVEEEAMTVASDLEDAGEEGGADFVRPIRKGGKQRRIVRETRHPPTPDELGLSRKHRKTQRLQWGVSYSRFKEAGESDCGCELHQQV